MYPTDQYRDLQALNLLHSLLVSGDSGSPSASAFLPPPGQLALISTLVIHPNLTTRASSDDLLEASNFALRYLWSVLKLLGPANVPLIDAFDFLGLERSGRARRKTRDTIFDTHKKDLRDVNNELATTSSLWVQVEDFWQVVGWAFNCSTAHKPRWERWSLWLDFMVTLFEDEMSHYHYSANIAHPIAPTAEDGQESLFLHYLTAHTLQNARERKILNSIFADGVSARFTSAFPEVWKNETKSRKKAKSANITTPSQERIDIEANEYRDYMADSGSDLEENSVAPVALTHNPDSETTALLGGSNAFDLRLRFIVLLSKVCISFPELIMTPRDFYRQLVGHIRPLPLPSFSAFLATNFLNNLHQDVASSLIQSLLQSFIEAAAPTAKGSGVSQDELVKLYLPYTANTTSVSDNAKMSVCIEALMRLLYKHGILIWSEHLEATLERGIAAREKKISRGKSKSDTGRAWMTASAERMCMCLEMLRQKSEG